MENEPEPVMVVQSQAPPKLVRKRQFRNEKEKLLHALALFRSLQVQPAKDQFGPLSQMISRPDLVTKVNELKSAIAKSKKERIQMFAQSQTLQHLLPPATRVRLMKENSAKQNFQSPLSFEIRPRSHSSASKQHSQIATPSGLGPFSRKRRAGSPTHSILSDTSYMAEFELERRDFLDRKLRSMFPAESEFAENEEIDYQTDSQISAEISYEKNQPSDQSHTSLNDSITAEPEIRDLNINVNIKNRLQNTLLDDLEDRIRRQQKERQETLERERQAEEERLAQELENINLKKASNLLAFNVLIALDVNDGVPDSFLFNKKFLCIDSDFLKVYNEGKDELSQYEIHFSTLARVLERNSDIVVIYTENFKFITHQIRCLSYDEYQQLQDLLIKICIDYKRDYQGSKRQQAEQRLSLDGKTVMFSNYEEKLREEMEKEENKGDISDLIECNSFEEDSVHEPGSDQEEQDASFASQQEDVEEMRIRTLTLAAQFGTPDGLANLLTKGGIFVKYGRWGKPKLRHIFVSADLKEVIWRPLTRDKPKKRQYIKAFDIVKVNPGRDTKNFRRFKRPEFESISFWLQTQKRTLDLEQCKDNLLPRETWINAFTALADGRLKRNDVVRYVKSRKNTGHKL